MPGSGLCLEGPACTADKSMCLCTRQRDTSHTQPVPSPALDLPPGRAQAGLWQPFSQGHSSPPGWEHRAAPLATRAGRSSPLETAVAARAAGHRGLTVIPQGITTGRGVFSKLREAEGPSLPPREDTTHCHTSTAGSGAQEPVNKAELCEAAGGRTFLGLVQLGLLLVVPAEGTLVLSVRLHTKLPPKAFHVVYRQHKRPQSSINRQPA